jgi:hypothetical protein
MLTLKLSDWRNGVEDKYCDQCDEKMSEVFNASEGFRFKGWYCERCRIFDKAIGRELKHKMDGQDGD